jgi:hypothetical protein
MGNGSSKVWFVWRKVEDEDVLKSRTFALNTLVWFSLVTLFLFDILYEDAHI